MSYDYRLLDGRITTRFGTRQKFAAALNMSEHSLSKKMCAKTPWKQMEIENACKLLGIDKNEIGIYFFTLKVQAT